MLLSPLHARCDSGGQAGSNLSQMSSKNTGFLRHLLSPLTMRPIISLSNHRADFWGLPARLHTHHSRRPSKALLWVIYNDTWWHCCCRLLSPHHRLLSGGSDPDPWHLLSQYRPSHNVHFSRTGLDSLHHPEGVLSVPTVNVAPDPSKLSIRAERHRPLCHGVFGLRLSFRTGWLSLTAEAKGHRVPLGTVTIPLCHFHSLIRRPRSLWNTRPCRRQRGRGGKNRGKDALDTWSLGQRKPRISFNISLILSY